MARYDRRITGLNSDDDDGDWIQLIIWMSEVFAEAPSGMV